MTHKNLDKTSAGAVPSKSSKNAWAPSGFQRSVNTQHMLQMRQASGLLGDHLLNHIEQRRSTGSQVQRKATGPSAAEATHNAAAEGLQGSSRQLPHLEQIQKSFGKHNVSSVQAHVGGPAREANEKMGALAYATGNAIAFKENPSLHTAAHEAAHIVQQRGGGVQLKDGIGQVGDRYEQHADTVADAVVQGKSAEGLLDGVGGATNSNASVQRRLIQMDDEEKKTEDSEPDSEDGGGGGDEPDLDAIKKGYNALRGVWRQINLNISANSKKIKGHNMFNHSTFGKLKSRLGEYEHGQLGDGAYAEDIQVVEQLIKEGASESELSDELKELNDDLAVRTKQIDSMMDNVKSIIEKLGDTWQEHPGGEEELDDKPEEGSASEKAKMRFQVQWNSSRSGPTFSTLAEADGSVGVKTVEAVAALNAAWEQVEPKNVREASEEAKNKQEGWINERPPSGIDQGGVSKSEYFTHPTDSQATDARVDIENIRGHNLKE